MWLTRDTIKDSDILLLDSDIIFDQRIIHMLLNSGPGNFLAVRSDQDIGEEEMKVIIGLTTTKIQTLLTTFGGSFDGKLRDELLNQEIFYTLTEAKVLI